MEVFDYEKITQTDCYFKYGYYYVFSVFYLCICCDAKENDNSLTEKISTESAITTSIPEGYGDITGIRSGTSSSTGLSIPFTIPQGGAYLYYKGASYTSLSILIRKSNGITIIGEPVGASTDVTTIPLHYRYVSEYYWPAGDYVLNVDFNESGKTYAFCLFASEYKLY